MRSPRIALKIKEPPRSQARRTVAGIRLGRGAVLPVEAAALGGGKEAAVTAITSYKTTTPLGLLTRP
jgi:hypothetical protein